MLISAGQSFSQSIPNSPDLSSNVKNELIDIVSTVFASEKQEYGFQVTDDISQIVIGKLFYLYIIPEKWVSQLKTCTNIKDMVEKGLLNYQIHSILYIGSRPVCLVEYYKAEDGIHLGGISASLVTNDINAIVNSYPNPILLTSYANQSFYFSNEVDNYLQMHPLEGVTHSGLSKALESTKSVFTLINEIESTCKNGVSK
jgi:hypothetical protein